MFMFISPFSGLEPASGKPWVFIARGRHILRPNKVSDADMPVGVDKCLGLGYEEKCGGPWGQ